MSTCIHVVPLHLLVRLANSNHGTAFPRYSAYLLSTYLKSLLTNAHSRKGVDSVAITAPSLSSLCGEVLMALRPPFVKQLALCSLFGKFTVILNKTLLGEAPLKETH